MAPRSGKAKSDRVVELLLTDSLDRPLGGAPYALFRHDKVEHGRLSAEGYVVFELPEAPEGDNGGSFVPLAELFVCHRTLFLGLAQLQQDTWIRDRLTNLGFDAGRPDRPLSPARLQTAIDAFLATANAQGESGSFEELLEGYYAGQLGVGIGLSTAALRAPPRGLFQRFREKRRAARARKAAVERAGSHLGVFFDAEGGSVRIALRAGPEGSPESRNRVSVFDWFSGHGTPPREGNTLTPLLDGENAWGRVADDIVSCQKELCVSSWFADPDIELRRPRELAIANPEQRAQHCLSKLVEDLARRGGTTHVLVWNWVGTPLVQPTLRKWAVEPDDRIEVLQHSHPSILGSFHEKTIVVDRQVAYCGGMNLRQNDWDTQQHEVSDPRRNDHQRFGWERRIAMPQHEPRHDVILRIQGPLVTDIHHNFVEHWNAALRHETRALRRFLGRIALWLSGSGPASAIQPMDAPVAQEGGMIAQFVRTDPRRKRRQQAIIDVVLRVIMNARKVLYIENQFFRSATVAAAIVETMRRKPNLRVIVLTNQVAGRLRRLNPLAYWTTVVQDQIRAQRPDFTLYELVSAGVVEGAVVYQPVFMHAKVIVVDDEWAMVGSANLNDRSIFSEYEANVAVEDGRFAKSLRRALMAEHLGLEEGDPRLADGREAADLFMEMARENAVARSERRIPQGRVHPFTQQGGVGFLRGRPEWF